jgi:hypothetical protein
MLSTLRPWHFLLPNEAHVHYVLEVGDARAEVGRDIQRSPLRCDEETGLDGKFCGPIQIAGWLRAGDNGGGCAAVAVESEVSEE